MNRKNQIGTVLLLGTVLFVACTTDESIVQTDMAGDALAQMNPETSIHISATLETDGNVSRAESNTVYTTEEIQPETQVDFLLSMPGASNPNQSGRTISGVAFSELGENLTLCLKDFNLVANGTQNVSRWTQLTATKHVADDYVPTTCSDGLIGVARLDRNDAGMPVLAYSMQHTRTKLTLIVTTDGTTPIDLTTGITASIRSKSTDAVWVNKDGLDFRTATAQVVDIDADPASFTLGFTAGTADVDFPLLPAVGTANGTTVTMLTGLVPATATHSLSEGKYLPIASPIFDSVLTINVADDYAGLKEDEMGGKYTLKLSQVTLADGTSLTSLKNGEHLTLTVTLRYNTLVKATATIGDWNMAEADITIGDGAKLPNNDNTNE